MKVTVDCSVGLGLCSSLNAHTLVLKTGTTAKEGALPAGPSMQYALSLITQA